MRQVLVGLRKDHSSSVMSKHPCRRVFTAMKLLAEYDFERPGDDRKCTEVEDLVMQGTQRDAVWYDVGASGLKPLDMGGFEPDRLSAEPQIVATDTATILVGEQDPLAEGRAASAELNALSRWAKADALDTAGAPTHLTELCAARQVKYMRGVGGEAGV